MRIYLDKDHFRIGNENHFNIIYLWWGINQWNNNREYEIGFGYWSKQLFK